MSKIKIKTCLKNKTEKEINNGEFLGIKTIDTIKYDDQSIRSIIKINSDVLIERKSKDYIVKIPLSLKKDTIGIYNIYSLGKIDLNIHTKELIVESNQIRAIYELDLNNSEKQEIEFYIKWEEI